MCDLCRNLESVSIPETVKRIGSCAFNEANITELRIPDSVEYIGGLAFGGNKNLESVHLGNSLDSLDGAFAGCPSITSITIPNSVKYIGYYTFDGCTSLDSVIIGSSVTYIGDYAFKGCRNITSLTCLAEVPPETGKAFDDIDKHMCTIMVPENSIDAYKVAPEWKYFFNPDLVEYRYDFESNGLYYKFVSKDELTCEVSYDIDEHTKMSTYDYQEVVIPETVSFESDTYTVVGIESGAFRNTPLENITLPKSITYLDGVFMECQKLTSIEVPENVTTIVGAFESCSSLKQIEIPESVVRLDGAFCGCSSLESIAFPDHITEITERTCANCTSLKSVKLPANLQKIGLDAFGNCTSLKSIVLPAHLEYIEEAAFASDWALTEVISLNPVPPYSDGRWCPFQVHNGTVHVPVGSKTAYQNESMWQYFTIIEDAEEALPIGQISIDHSATKSYDLLGRPSNGSNSGLFIKDKKIILRR